MRSWLTPGASDPGASIFRVFSTMLAKLMPQNYSNLGELRPETRFACGHPAVIPMSHTIPSDTLITQLIAAGFLPPK